MSDELEGINEQLVLVGGESATGKSASLRNIRNQDRWLYLNCEAGKRLPFRNKFSSHVITDPYQIEDAFDETLPGASMHDDVDGLIVDTITFMMEMFESLHIVPSADTQKAWGDYFQFFKRLMQHHVASSGKSVICFGHTLSTYDEKIQGMRSSVPVKGALKNNGLEAYFSTVVATKKVDLKTLEKYANDLLNITEEDELLGFKYVFQTRLTKETVGERIRSPMGLFTREQTYMDNDAQMLLDHLAAYYG